MMPPTAAERAAALVLGDEPNPLAPDAPGAKIDRLYDLAQIFASRWDQFEDRRE